MSWKKIEIKTNQGTFNAQAPVIVSASRATDIPAFYSDWFIERLKEGYLKWKNPFNGVPLYVSFNNTRLIVFWSKNPKPLLSHLNYLEDKGINFYFQFTLNDYEKEGLEKHVPRLDSRIETFIKLSEKIGKEKVIWRFDPYLLTQNTGVQELLRKTEYIGNKLKGYTDKFVFSYADIKTYKKVQNNLRREAVPYLEFNENSMIELAHGLNELNKQWGYSVGTCAEKIELERFNIEHNKCIDDDLIIRLFSGDSELMNFLGVKIQEPTIFEPESKIVKTKSLKDKGQREICGCILSKDIGQYNTCPHECLYCYANSSREIADKNYKTHKLNRLSETIIGE
jgi:DNA repair photolyase